MRLSSRGKFLFALIAAVAIFALLVTGDSEPESRARQGWLESCRAAGLSYGLCHETSQTHHKRCFRLADGKEMFSAHKRGKRFISDAYQRCLDTALRSDR